jgi:hypothetical protein
MTNQHAHDSSSNLWLTGVIGKASSAQAPGVGALDGANSVRWEHDILMDRPARSTAFIPAPNL